MKEAKTPKRARQLRDLILSWMAEANSCRLGELAGITPSDIRKGLAKVGDCQLTLEGEEPLVFRPKIASKIKIV